MRPSPWSRVTLVLIIYVRTVKFQNKFLEIIKFLEEIKLVCKKSCFLLITRLSEIPEKLNVPEYMVASAYENWCIKTE